MASESGPDSQTAAVCRYIVTARERSYPEDVIDEARKCLVDWVGVCMGAYDATEAKAVSAVMAQWNTGGDARLLWGGSAGAAAAAMVNGTLSHCLDYDDTHIPSAIHVSGPLWAAVLAVGSARSIDEALLLKAFVTGFEVAARVGDGTGVRLNNQGWHATATLGPLGVAAALAVVLGFDEKQSAHALGLAATQAGGLTASFGTMAKPFHAGKAAMNGILAAELAAMGFEGPSGVLDAASPLVGTLLQDRVSSLDLAPLDGGWEIKRNSFKPYAACQLTHAAVDAARAAGKSVTGQQIESIRAYVNPLTLRIANVRNARTPTEGKFSLAFCIALGLRDHALTTQDFTAERLGDPALIEIASRVEAIPSENISRTSARLEIRLADGRTFTQIVEHAFGSIGNPMRWPELESKFMALATAAVGRNAAPLLQSLQQFEKPGSLGRLFALSSIPETARSRPAP